MAVRVTCPSCKSKVVFGDDMRGRTVRCPECDKPFGIPDAGSAKEENAIQEDRKVKVKSAAAGRIRDEDDDDRPAPKKKKKGAKQGFPILLVGGAAAALVLVLLLGLGGISAFLLTWRSPAVEPQPAAQAAQADPKPVAVQRQEPQNPNPNPNPVPDANAGKPLPTQMAADVIGRVKESTVYLRVTLPSGQTSEGSGFFAFEPGMIVTNAHVLGMLRARSPIPSNVAVVVNSGETNKRTMKGQVIGVDRSGDLAVLRVNEANLPTPLQLESGRPLIETQKVYIFGFPFGTQLGANPAITVSDTTVSSLRKDATGALDRIQVNGGMHPGNSGGPVVNANGKLVGVAVAGIKGTQINFAIPADHVRLVMEGRLADASFGEAYVDAGRTLMPVRYTCLDPLNRIRQVRVEVWTGRSGDPRPSSPQKPQSLAGDSPRQSFEVAYRNGEGKLDVQLPQAPQGQVCWLQPVITTAAGTTHWGVAQATPASLIPLERKGANLLVKLDGVKERTIRLQSSLDVTLLKGKDKKTFADKLQMDILEMLSPDARGTAIRITTPKVKLTTEEDGNVVPSDGRAQDGLRQILPNFVIDGTNRMRVRGDPSLNPQLPPLLREQLTDCYTQLCNSLEATTIPMPNKMMQPKQSWTETIPMLVRAGKRPEVVRLALTCTYEGTRAGNQGGEAVIAVAGKVIGSTDNAGKVGGDVAGKLAFDLAGGFVSKAKLAIVTELDLFDSDVEAIVAFNVQLERELGNPIQITPAAPPKSNPAIKGKIIASLNAVLLPNDGIDRVRKSRAKLHPVPMQAGKTYVISLTSNAFDSYLRLESPNGQPLAEDDDGGGFPNARIVYRAAQSGVYRAVATTFDGKLGPYQLVVQELP